MLRETSTGPDLINTTETQGEKVFLTMKEVQGKIKRLTQPDWFKLTIENPRLFIERWLNGRVRTCLLASNLEELRYLHDNLMIRKKALQEYGNSPEGIKEKLNVYNERRLTRNRKRAIY